VGTQTRFRLMLKACYRRPTLNIDRRAIPITLDEHLDPGFDLGFLFQTGVWIVLFEALSKQSLILFCSSVCSRPSSGTAVVSGTIANNEFYLDESGAKQQVTTFVDFNVWAKRGEALAQMARKGQHVYLEGQLRQEIWEDKKDGSTRSKHVIRVRDWQFTQFRTPEAAPVAAASSSGSGTKASRSRRKTASIKVLQRIRPH
jgi:single stranded DNA-binding protein